MATCLLEARDLPPYLCAEVVNYVSYIHNKVPHKSVARVTPFEVLMGHKANVSHLSVFGSKAWAKIATDKKKSFQPSRNYILQGYTYDENAYKIMVIATIRCFIK